MIQRAPLAFYSWVVNVRDGSEIAWFEHELLSVDNIDTGSSHRVQTASRQVIDDSSRIVGSIALNVNDTDHVHGVDQFGIMSRQSVSYTHLTLPTIEP